MMGDLEMSEGTLKRCEVNCSKGRGLFVNGAGHAMPGTVGTGGLSEPTVRYVPLATRHHPRLPPGK